MKTTLISRGLLAMVFVGLIFVSSCGDDDPVVDPLVGNYKLTSATYLGLFDPTPPGTTIEVAMTVAPLGEIPVQSPISDLVIGVLNGVPECANPADVTIELRADFSLWITCNGTVGADQEASGVWTKDSATQVSLVIAPTDAIPTGLTLVLQDVSLTGNTMSTNVSGVPLPKDLTVELGAPLPEDGGLNIQLISVAMVLDK